MCKAGRDFSLRGVISAHLRVDYMYFSMKHDVVAFTNVWGLGNVLCTVVGYGGGLCEGFMKMLG